MSLAEHQDSVEQFLRIASNLMRFPISWRLESSLRIKLLSPKALEEPCSSVIRAIAFLPTITAFASNRFRQSWSNIGIDLFNTIFREAILMKDFLKHMGYEAKRVLFSTSLGASLGFALVSPIKYELHEKLKELIACELWPGFIDDVAEYDVPKEGIPLYYVSAFGVTSLAMAYFALTDPLGALDFGRILFEAVEEYLRRGRVELASEFGTVTLTLGQAVLCFGGECVKLALPIPKT